MKRDGERRIEPQAQAPVQTRCLPSRWHSSKQNISPSRSSASCAQGGGGSQQPRLETLDALCTYNGIVVVAALTHCGESLDAVVSLRRVPVPLAITPSKSQKENGVEPRFSSDSTPRTQPSCTTPSLPIGSSPHRTRGIPYSEAISLFRSDVSDRRHGGLHRVLIHETPRATLYWRDTKSRVAAPARFSIITLDVSPHRPSIAGQGSILARRAVEGDIWVESL